MPAILLSNLSKMSGEDDKAQVNSSEGDVAKSDSKMEEKKEVTENGDSKKNSSEGEEEEVEVKAEKKEKPSKRKAAAAKKVKDESDEDAEQGDEGSDVEEESPKKKKKKKKKATPKKSPAKKARKKESSDEGEVEEEEKPKSPKKRASPKKTKVQEEEEEADEVEEDAAEDSEDELKKKGVPLLDQPLEVAGSRERKKVSRFEEDFVKAKEEKKFEIPEGKGIQLGKIPRIEYNISKCSSESLKSVCKALFGRRAPAKAVIKKNIRLFNGYDFDEKSDHWEKRKAILLKLGMKHLKLIADVLDVEKQKGTVPVFTERIMNFCLNPQDSGKKVPGPRAKRKSATKVARKSYAESEDSDDKPARSVRAKGKRKSLKDASSSDTDGSVKKSGSDVVKKSGRKTKAATYKDESSEEENKNEKSESESDVEKKEEKIEEEEKVAEDTAEKSEGSDAEVEKEEKPKKAKKSPAKKAPAKAAKKAPVKKTAAKKKVLDDVVEDKDGSASEDEPLVKKAKPSSPPSDEDIKTYVKKILEGADLEQITMKTVCKQVYEHYPEHDLAHKKDLIKETVKSLIAT